MCGVNAYTEAVKMFAQRDPAEMARGSGGTYDATRHVITVKYMNSPVEVSYPSGEINGELPFDLLKNDRVLIIQYLVFSCGLAPRSNWISFLQLPDGINHLTPFMIEAVNPLAEACGTGPDMFRKRVGPLGAAEVNLGDYGAVIPAFPHIPVAVGIWQGDDEFPASATILFDVTAPLHLSTAALWVLGVEVSRKIRGVGGQQFSR